MTNRIWINVYWDPDEEEQFLGVHHYSQQVADKTARDYDCRRLYHLRIRLK